MQYIQVGLLKYSMASAVHLMVNPVHLLANAVHPSEAPDVHHGISSTLVVKYSTPSEAPDVHDDCCRLGGKCSTPNCAPDVYDSICSNLLANTVHQVRLLMYMMSVVDLKGKCSTPKCVSWCT